MTMVVFVAEWFWRITPAVLWGKNFNAGHSMQTFQRQIRAYHPCAHRDQWLVVTRSVETKPAGYIFSCTFHLIRMKFYVALKHFNIIISIPLLSEISYTTGTNRCFSDCVKNGMHLDVSGPIWFKLGLMIVTTELYTLILVYAILICVQGHWGKRNQKYLRHLPHTFSIDLGRIYNLLIWRTSFHLLQSISKRKNDSIWW